MATYNTGNNNQPSNNVFLNANRIVIKGITFEVTIKSANLATPKETKKAQEFFEANIETVSNAVKERLEITSAGVSGAAASRTFDDTADI